MSEQRDGVAGGRGALASVLNKSSDLAVKLAALGLRYQQASRWVGSVKSSLCRWVRQKVLGEPELRGQVLEQDGIWTRFLSGPKELKVIRDDLGVVLGHFGSWEEAIDRGWQAGAQDPLHLVSDGDRAIAQGLQLVYGRQAPHQLCHFHLLQEYRRNLGWEEAKKLLSCQSRREGADYVKRIVAVTGGRGAYWCRKALNQGLRHLDTGQERYKTTSRLERLDRELRRREKLGTVWSPHNLLALLQIRGHINQTT